MSSQTNVSSLARKGGDCIVPTTMPGSASRTNLGALTPGEVEVLREFFLLLNEWNEAEGRHGN
jgi:hypothetical protein